MRLHGEVHALRDAGEDVEVTLTNIRRDSAAVWREYSKELVIRMPHSLAESFYIGRPVRVEVTPR